MVRWGEPSSALPLSDSARVRSFTGSASTAIPASTTTTVSTGTFVTRATQRAPMVLRPPSAGRFSRAALEVGLGRIRSPKIASTAGSRVSATATATATPAAAASPITDRNGIWATDSPQRAMITVVPAKTTAEPAVAEAWAIDSSTACPATSWRRCRVTMNRP